MSKTYVLKEEKGLGCFNLVIWDFLIVAIVTGYAIHEYFKLHVLFCIIIGVISGTVIISLMKIRYIGSVFQIICAVFWSRVLWGLINEIFSPTDPVWIWGIQIGLAIVCIALHFASASEIIGNNTNYHDKNMNTTTNNMQYVDKGESGLQEKFDAAINTFFIACDEREQVMTQAQKVVQRKGAEKLYELIVENDTIWSEGSTKISVYKDMLTNANSTQEQITVLKKWEDLLGKMKEATKLVLLEVNKLLAENMENGNTSSSEIDESLFAGCTDKDSFIKRYKSLMKTFHPDNSDGDSAMTIKIKNTYDEMLKKF